MDKEYSGVPEYSYNLIKELLTKDKHNDYILFYNSFFEVEERFNEFRQLNAEVVNFGYPNKIFNYIMQKGLGLPKINEKLGVDLFLMPHFNFVSLSDSGKKIITIHDLSFLKNSEYFSLRKTLWHKIINIGKTLRNFDKIIAISESTKNDLVSLLDISEKKIEVVHSGIDSRFAVIEDKKNNTEILRVKRKYSLPDKFIFFLGSIEPRKNIISVIRAYELMHEKNMIDNDTYLVLAGASGWKNEKIFKFMKKSPFSHMIKFLGFVDSRDKKYLYNLASVFVYPSFYEGFGFPPLEAQKCGTPVVVSNSSSMPEIIADSGIMIDPLNVQELANGLSLVLNNLNLREQLIKRGVENSSKYNWSQTADKYLDIFSSL